MTDRDQLTEGLWFATDFSQRADRLAWNAKGTLLAVTSEEAQADYDDVAHLAGTRRGTTASASPIPEARLRRVLAPVAGSLPLGRIIRVAMRKERVRQAFTVQE
jgi:hypothetical protein